MRPVPALLAALLALAAPSALAGPPAPPGPRPAPSDGAGLEAEVERLLRDLASDAYSVREAARKRLQAIAPAARGVLEARKDDPDPEVRRTVRGLLDAVAGPREEAPGPPADLADVSRVTFSAEGPLAEVLERFGAQCGGAFKAPPAAAATPVKVAAARAPYFEALEAILAPARVEAAEGFDEAGSAVLSTQASAARAPSGFAGPFRLDVDAVSAVRPLRSAGRMRYELGVKAVWSPDVAVTSYSQPVVTKVVDALDRAWRAPPTQGTVYYGGSNARRTFTQLSLSLDPPEGELAAALATLEVQMRFRVRYGRQEATFSDPAGAALPATRSTPLPGAGKGEVRLTLEAFAPDPERGGWWMATVGARLPPGVAADGLSALLEPASGPPRTMYDLASRVTASDGSVKVTLRAPGGAPDEKPKALRLAWYSAEGEAPMTFVVKDVPLR